MRRRTAPTAEALCGQFESLITSYVDVISQAPNISVTAEAIAASLKDSGGDPTFLAIDASEAIAQNHPAYEATEIPSGTFGSPDRPDDEVKTISFAHHIVARKCRY